LQEGELLDQVFAEQRRARHRHRIAAGRGDPGIGAADPGIGLAFRPAEAELGIDERPRAAGRGIGRRTAGQKDLQGGAERLDALAVLSL
jgi:hypothetical protein